MQYNVFFVCMYIANTRHNDNWIVTEVVTKSYCQWTITSLRIEPNATSGKKIIIFGEMYISVL